MTVWCTTCLERHGAVRCVTERGEVVVVGCPRLAGWAFSPIQPSPAVRAHDWSGMERYHGPPDREGREP